MPGLLTISQNNFTQFDPVSNVLVLIGQSCNKTPSLCIKAVLPFSKTINISIKKHDITFQFSRNHAKTIHGTFFSYCR
jgi:hypothetical protein